MLNIAVVCKSMPEFRSFVQADMPRHITYRTCDATSRQVNYYPILPSTHIDKVRGAWFDEVHILEQRVVLQECMWDHIISRTGNYKVYSTAEAEAVCSNHQLSIIGRI